MQRFRSTWLALMGGILLVTFSISAAFGAAPSSTQDGTRGQSIAGYVHELLFGADDETSDETEEETTEDGEEDTDASDDSEDEAGDEAEDEVDETEDAAASSHGECVSEVAQDPGAIGGANENHGGAVSEAARITCWETEDGDEEEAVDEDTTEETADELSAKEQAKADREAARAERKAERDAAKAERKANHGRP